MEKEEEDNSYTTTRLLRREDVIRGPHHINSSGNKRFRQIVRIHFNDFWNTSKGDRKKRKRIVEQVRKDVKPGRFVELMNGDRNGPCQRVNSSEVQKIIRRRFESEYECQKMNLLRTEATKISDEELASCPVNAQEIILLARGTRGTRRKNAPDESDEKPSVKRQRMHGDEEPDVKDLFLQTLNSLQTGNGASPPHLEDLSRHVVPPSQETSPSEDDDDARNRKSPPEPRHNHHVVVPPSPETHPKENRTSLSTDNLQIPPTDKQAAAEGAAVPHQENTSRLTSETPGDNRRQARIEVDVARDLHQQTHKEPDAAGDNCPQVLKAAQAHNEIATASAEMPQTATTSNTTINSNCVLLSPETENRSHSATIHLHSALIDQHQVPLFHNWLMLTKELLVCSVSTTWLILYQLIYLGGHCLTVGLRGIHRLVHCIGTFVVYAGCLGLAIWWFRLHDSSAVELKMTAL
jgi:hypothetical protein